MRKSIARTMVAISVTCLAGLISPPAFAQTDPATQRMIDQLRFSGATRGMVRPQAGPAATDPQPAPQAAPAAEPQRAPSQAAPARPAATPAAARPTTTAPAGVPALSLTINFASGSAVLTPGAMEQLNRLGRALTSPDLAPYRFRIEGHTDTVGPAEENRALSERRAIAVKDYLAERFSISPDRLVTEGLGESRLLVPTGDETPQLQNRRVQVLNLGS